MQKDNEVKASKSTKSDGRIVAVAPAHQKSLKDEMSLELIYSVEEIS